MQHDVPAQAIDEVLVGVFRDSNGKEQPQQPGPDLPQQGEEIDAQWLVQPHAQLARRHHPGADPADPVEQHRWCQREHEGTGAYEQC
ncbi:hypothetical protein [Micromonospora zamorensis]|uniref:Uncharacterized protein n=1 Tax=Micromonospora zamorensis TaxID=709883 RepID=A0ABZ1PQV2_9ACTN